MVSGDPEELRAYRDVVAAYEERNPGIDVRLIEIADRDEMITKLATSFAGGSPPDAFLMNYRYVGQFEAKGTLEPLGPYLDRAGSPAEADFYRQALDAFRFDGTIVCLPQNVSILVVYYNEDLFREAGLKPPVAGWTWADMVSMARKMTRDSDGDGAADVYGLGVDPEVIRLAPFVWSNGGEVVDDPDRPTRFTLTNPNSIVALQEFLDLRRVDRVVPTDVEVESEDLESRFLSGRLGMLMESRKVVPVFRTIRGFGWDVAPLPEFREPAGILHSDAYCMTAASDDKDATWSFIEFALGPEGQAIAARTGRTVPSLRSVAGSAAFLDPAQEPRNSRVFLDAIPTLRSVPHISTWPEIEDAANHILEDAIYEGGNASEVAEEIALATTPIFERAER
jgi:multiple sugar transport system substrate-binding protein